MQPSSLLVFDTHPIQYRAPVFRELFQRLPNMKVVFFSGHFDGSKWWFQEVGKIPSQPFKVAMQEGYPNQYLIPAPHKTPRAFLEIFRLLKAERPKAVLTYGYYLPEHWALRLFCRWLRIPLIFVGETFSLGAPSLRRSLKMPLLQFFFRGVSRFIAIGEKNASHYRRLGIPDRKILQARYCTDVNYFRLEKEERTLLRTSERQKLGIPENAFVALFVGRLFERKRPEDLIAIHQKLQDKYPQLWTVVVGNGEMEAELKAAAHKCPQFVFAGFKSQPELRSFYAAADVLLVPSRYETWGLVINEAFASRMPAIVTDTCGAAQDLVIDGSTGFVYPVGNTDDAALALAKLLDSPALHEKLSSNAQKKVCEEYSPAQFADAISQAVKQL